MCLSRHICFLASFSSQRSCDRRIHKLIEAGYIERKKILYGIPSLYFLTTQGRKLIQVSTRADKVKIEQILHDVLVLDTAIYFIQKFKLELESITTEKQLHMLDGFSQRAHRPDFVFRYNNKVFCVEIECSMKSKSRFEKNISTNFIDYDEQIWVVPNPKDKISLFLKSQENNYPNIIIIPKSEVII